MAGCSHNRYSLQGHQGQASTRHVCQQNCPREPLASGRDVQSTLNSKTRTHRFRVCRAPHGTYFAIFCLRGIPPEVSCPSNSRTGCYQESSTGPRRLSRCPQLTEFHEALHCCFFTTATNEFDMSYFRRTCSRVNTTWVFRVPRKLRHEIWILGLVYSILVRPSDGHSIRQSRMFDASWNSRPSLALCERSTLHALITEACVQLFCPPPTWHSPRAYRM